MSDAAARPAVALANLLVQAGLALAIFVAGAAPVGQLWLALRGPATFADRVPSPAWLAVPVVAGVLLLARLVAYARGRSLGPAWVWAAVVSLGAVLLARELEPPPREGWTSLFDAPPALQSSELLRSLSQAVEAGLREKGRVPEAASLAPALRVDGREVVPNYVFRGLARRPFRVRELPGADGPVDSPLPGDEPGVFYLAVSPDRQHYWLTAVVLLEENGRLITAMLPGPQGTLTFSNAPQR